MTQPMPAPAPMPDPGESLSGEVLAPQAASAQPSESPAFVPAADLEPPAKYATGLVKELTLPSGAVVKFRDPDSLVGDDQRAVVDAIRNENKQLSAAMDVVYGTACMLIDTWTLDMTVPRFDTKTLGRVPIRDYRAIQDAVAPISALIFGDADSLDGPEKPGSPTRPAIG